MTKITGIAPADWKPGEIVEPIFSTVDDNGNMVTLDLADAPEATLLKISQGMLGQSKQLGRDIEFLSAVRAGVAKANLKILREMARRHPGEANMQKAVAMLEAEAAEFEALYAADDATQH